MGPQGPRGPLRDKALSIQGNLAGCLNPDTQRAFSQRPFSEGILTDTWAGCKEPVREVETPRN